MNTKILAVLIAGCCLLACSKDKFTSKPQLTYKKVNTKELHQDGQIVFTLEVTDAEGDIGDPSDTSNILTVKESVKNCNDPSAGFSQSYPMPEFTAVKNLKGEINVCYSYGTSLSCPPLQTPQCQRNDTAVFKFVIRDKAHNVSDTATSEEVVIVY